ncbi:MAG: RNA polymerase sigma factor [Planctomycetota bacterium]
MVHRASEIMPSPTESKHLVAAAANGSGAALDELFERCRGRLRRLLWLKAGLVLRHAELDDLVQEAQLEALRQFDQYTYQGPDSFFRWLATVAVHRLGNLHRIASAQKRDPRAEQPLGVGDSRDSHGGSVTPSLADLGPGPRTRTVGIETQERLEQALRQLSVTDREVIVMARFEDLPLPEIAARLGRTRNAVALLLSRALRKLKERLDAGETER